MSQDKVNDNEVDQDQNKVIDFKSIGVLTMADLLQSQANSPDFLVDDLLPAQGISIIGGKPKDGKSTLIRNLIYAVATGQPFLGRKVKSGSVLYLALEETDYYVGEHFRLMGAQQETPIHTSFDRLSLSKLKNVISHIRPVLVVIDPLFLFIQVNDGNSYTEVYKEMGELNTIAREFQTHVLTVHHIKKGQTSGPDSLLGSTALFGSVHTSMIMETIGSERRLSTKQKYGESLEPSILNFDKDRKAYSFGGSVEDQREDRLQQEILKLIKERRSVSHSEVMAAITGRKQSMTDALKGLVESGNLKKSGMGNRTSPFVYSLESENSLELPFESNEGGGQ